MRCVQRRDLRVADQRVVAIHPLAQVALFGRALRRLEWHAVARVAAAHRTPSARPGPAMPGPGLVAGLVGAQGDAIHPVRAARAEGSDVERGGVAGDRKLANEIAQRRNAARRVIAAEQVGLPKAQEHLTRRAGLEVREELPLQYVFAVLLRRQDPGPVEPLALDAQRVAQAPAQGNATGGVVSQRCRGEELSTERHAEQNLIDVGKAAPLA